MAAPNYEYVMKFDLLAFDGSNIIESVGGEGKSVQGVFIPIEENYLTINQRHVYVYAFINEKKTCLNNDWTHYIKQMIPKYKVKTMKDRGFITPFLGFFKKRYISFADKRRRQMFNRVENIE